MLIFTIVLNAIAIIAGIIVFILNSREGYFGASLLMVILVGVNTYCLIRNINRINNPQDEVKTYVVSNVKEYYIDSTIVINGADTTKTYIITYLK